MEAALASTVYLAPALRWSPTSSEVNEVVWWVVLVGFSFAAALAWATYCRITGGYPEISFGWKGFKVACKSS